jgi:hypothetical protein
MIEVSGLNPVVIDDLSVNIVIPEVFEIEHRVRKYCIWVFERELYL